MHCSRCQASDAARGGDDFARRNKRGELALRRVRQYSIFTVSWPTTMLRPVSKERFGVGQAENGY